MTYYTTTVLSTLLCTLTVLPSSEPVNIIAKKRSDAEKKRWEAESALARAYDAKLTSKECQQYLRTKLAHESNIEPDELYTEAKEKYHASAEYKQHSSALALWSTAYYKAAALNRMEKNLHKYQQSPNIYGSTPSEAMHKGLYKSLHNDHAKVKNAAQLLRRDTVEKELRGLIESIEHDLSIKNVEKYY